MSVFITLEGIEGAGKSSVQRGLAARLSADGHQVLSTREPGATELGAEVRSLVLTNKSITPRAELLLFAADRAQHVEQVLKPALAAGTIILCDRYVHSTIAYQGFGRGLDRGALERIIAFATEGLMPNLALLLDIEPEQGLLRASKRQTQTTEGEWTRFEEEELAFHQRIRRGFLELAADPLQKIRTIDASLNQEAVLEVAYKAVSELL